MRKIYLLIVVALSAILTSQRSFAQTTTDDYIKFDGKGGVAFKKTAPDGSTLEVLNEHPGTSPYYYPITVKCTDGEILEAFIYTQYYFDGFDKFYEGYVSNAKSFNTAINEIKALSAYSKEHPATVVQPDGTVLTYVGSSDSFYVNTFTIPIGENGDYYTCEMSTRRIDGRNRPTHVRYFDKKHLSPDYYGTIQKIRRSFSDCVVEMSVFNYQEVRAEITYNDGRSYSGTLNVVLDNYLNDFSGSLNRTVETCNYWANATKFDTGYLDGVLKESNGNIKAYKNGQYSMFESENIKARIAKQEADAKAEAEAMKKGRIELNKKYGEKYVTAVLAGKLLIGTPEELFLLGVKYRLFSSITSVELQYKTARTSVYKAYGWKDYGSTITSSGLLGFIRFENGVLTSALK